jgi:hypothetical protein
MGLDEWVCLLILGMTTIHTSPVKWSAFVLVRQARMLGKSGSTVRSEGLWGGTPYVVPFLEDFLVGLDKGFEDADVPVECSAGGHGGKCRYG